MNYSAYSLESVNIPNSQNTKRILRLGNKEFRKLKNQEILIKHKYIGMNFYDIDICRSIIKKPDNFSPGIEAMGEIVEIGQNLKTDFKVGDRVCYCTHSSGGGYGEYNIIHENFAIFIPKYLQDHMACAGAMRGIFSFALLNRVFRIDQDCYVLIFNPTGGLGHILSQLAKYYGAYVISVISRLDDDSNYDESLLKKHGADLILDRNDTSINKKILSYTGGKGVNVIYDTIGDENLLQFASVMQYCGLYVSIGQNCGVNLKVSMHKISEKSIFLTRPSLFHYKSFSNDLRLTATEIFELMKKQVIQPYVNNIYSFNNLKEAHKDMINRKTRYINLIEI
jgi:NADPH2:quinone reductase